MTAFATEIRLAARGLLKTRGFTATALVTLSLGMTLFTTAMVAVNAYLLNDLPYPAADRLYEIRYGAPGQPQPGNMEALDWRSLDDVIEHPIAWDLDMFYLLGGEHTEAAPGAWITQGFAAGLGIHPAMGQPFEPAAFAQGSENVALISHRLWTNRFGGDPAIVGRTFSAYVSDRPQEAESFRIIGVLPQRFWHVNPYTDVLVPLRAPTYPYMARLREGVSPAAAADRIKALVTAGAARVPENWAPRVASVHDAYVTQARPVLRTTTIAAALVLLVGCANVAGLLLVRATRRSREVAIRVALGASRAAIARMLLAEGLILGGVATIVALFATHVALESVAPLIQQQLGRPAPGGVFAFSVNLRVAALAASAGMLTAIVCALAPLATSRRAALVQGLQTGSRAATEGPAARRIRAALIALEIAASVTLLAGSALMVRSVVNLLAIDFGISTERVLNASLTLRQHRYPDAASRAAVFERIVAGVSAVSGVESVGLTTSWPLQQPRIVPIETAGSADRVSLRSGIHGVSHGFFQTLEIPLVAGRVFGSGDRLGSEPVAIVSESLARRLWPSDPPVGGRLLVPQAQERGEPIHVQRTVVGVVRDVKQSPTDADLADVYVPMLQAPTRFTFVLTRTAGAAAALLPAVKTALHGVDSQFALDRARPLQAIVDEMTLRPRFMASLLGWFALVAAVLALVGVYGVVAYAVRQREREIAVRLAVGADPSRITRLFVRQGAAVILFGLAAGVAAALGAGRLVESQLFGVTPRDPLAIGAAVIAFGVSGLFAIWWPARRAAATDPAIALRTE
jgi:predicted permease